MHVLILALVLATTVGSLASQSVAKLLVIGLDGVRPDALAAANTPSLDALIAAGCYSADAQCENLTFSGPNWATILHGVHRDRNGVVSNAYTLSQLANFPDFFAYLEAHQSSWNTVRITTWDAIYLYQPTGADIDLFSNYATGGDAVATQWAEQLMVGSHPSYPGLDVDAMFVYLADADVVGHSAGFHPASPAYLQELADIDVQIGRIVTAMQARANYGNEDWLIVMTSDHGGSITGGHSGNTWEKRRIPFLVSGPSAVVGVPHPAPKNVDVAKTALAHMGVAIPATLDGHVVGLSPTSGPALAFDANLISNSGAEYDRGFDDMTLDQYLSGWNDPGPDQGTAVRWGAPNGFPSSSSSGPANRGNNFFSGGSFAGSRMTQSIDVSGFAAVIDGGVVSFDLGGWFGGYASQDDRASLSAFFRDAAGTLLGVTTTGNVTAAERGNVTGLLQRSASAGVPVGTRTVVIALDTHHDSGWTDGYADELSFVLRLAQQAPPPALDRYLPTTDATEWRFTGDTGGFIDAAYGPGTMAYADGIGGATNLNDVFGVSDGITIPHIDGVPVDYLHFKARSAPTEGYEVRPNIPSPGGGIEQFTMIFDFLVEPQNLDDYMGIWNSSASNSNDSEFFLRPINTGYWTAQSSTAEGVWPRGEWFRLVLVNDLTGNSVRIYLNGSPVHELFTYASDFVWDGTVYPFFFLTDDTPGETSEGYIANYAFVKGILGDDEIGALGGPSADGIFIDPLQFYGCGVNPADSLTRLNGSPQVGATLTLGVHNPLGTQSLGSAAFLGLSLYADPAFPCGTVYPGWGMQSAAAPGELLIAAPVVSMLGAPWNGASVPFAVVIPNNPGLVGLEFYAQGVIIDFVSDKIGLGGAVKITVH